MSAITHQAGAIAVAVQQLANDMDDIRLKQPAPSLSPLNLNTFADKLQNKADVELDYISKENMLQLLQYTVRQHCHVGQSSQLSPLRLQVRAYTW